MLYSDMGRVNRLLVKIQMFGACVLMTLWASLPARAQATGITATEIRQKINVSGRQRMLSQRMAASSCLAMAGFDATNRAEVAWMSHLDFDNALNGLQYGDETLQLPPEDDPDILAAFAEVEQIWDRIGAAVLQISSGDMHSVVVRQLTRDNVPLLTSSNAAVSRIVERYGDEVIDPAKAKTINIAGRQRMLSQKMMKEACFVAISLDLEANSQALAQTVALFDASLKQLREGDPAEGVMVPPNTEISRQLDHVASLWDTYRLKLSLVEPVPRTTPQDMANLAQQSDAVLREMHKAVLLYVAADAN